MVLLPPGDASPVSWSSSASMVDDPTDLCGPVSLACVSPSLSTTATDGVVEVLQRHAGETDGLRKEWSSVRLTRIS